MITPTPSDQPTGRQMTIPYGSFGSGKTTFAATISDDCPEWLTCLVQPPPPSADVATLRDMAWIAFDRNALAGFASLKLRVPLLYDLSSVAPAKIVEETLAVIADIAKQGVPHTVFDTGTTYDVQLQMRHRLKGDNKMAFYAAILNDWAMTMSALRQLDSTLQIPCHVKAAFDADNEAKAKRQLMEVPDFAAQITGQAGSRLKADCDNILFLRRKSLVLNGKKMQKVVASTQPIGLAECKVRGGAGLPDEIDADWRVIRAALAATAAVTP